MRIRLASAVLDLVTPAVLASGALLFLAMALLPRPHGTAGPAGRRVPLLKLLDNRKTGALFYGARLRRIPTFQFTLQPTEVFV